MASAEAGASLAAPRSPAMVHSLTVLTSVPGDADQRALLAEIRRVYGFPAPPATVTRATTGFSRIA